jgi:hypothetical protein
MIRSKRAIWISISILALTSLLARGAKAGTTDRGVALSTTKLKPAKVSGKWRLAWDVRLGTVRGVLDLKQKADQVSGTFFEEINGHTYSLSGSVQGKDITFDIPFPEGPLPYTIEFKGTVDPDKMTGTSAMKGVGQVFLGHAGEVDEPQRPWTATKGLKHPNNSPNKRPDDDDDDERHQ